MKQSMWADQAKNRTLLIVYLLIFILWLAFSLRLIYVRRVGPFADEYISMLAMKSIVELGVPVLPSGLFYGPKALLHSYMGALAMWLFGSSVFAIRFPSVLAGIAAVCFIYKAGRRWFSPMVGVSAAVALAWLSSAVEWGGRARMYSLLLLLCLMGAYFLINGYMFTHNRWERVLGMLVMLLAVYAHTLALIVFGGLVVGVMMSWLILPPKPKSILIPSFWEALVWLVFIIGVIILDPMGGLWGAQVRLSDVAQGSLNIQSIQERSPYLLAFTHQFVVWPLWPLTILYAVGFINLSLRLIRRSSIPGDGVALCLYVLILCAWVATSILSGLHDDRYLFEVLPFYLLLALRELYLLIKSVRTSIKLKLSFGHADTFVITGIISLLIIALFAPSIGQLVAKDTYGFAPAYFYVRDNWHSGDIVTTCLPPASQWILGHVDYYVNQNGPESYKGDDIWIGVPLVNTREKFATILDNETRVWFVVEKLCWERQFDSDFQDTVHKNMQIAYNQKGMLVFISKSNQMK